MNFALIADDTALPRLREWVATARGQVVDLPDSGTVDAVIVSGSHPAARSLVTDLVRQGKTVWIVPEAALKSELAYEFIPLDEEHPEKLRALWPLRSEPAVAELRSRLADGSWGEVLHLQLERTEVGRPVFPPEAAHAAWLQDADLLRSLVRGEYQRVTAIHSGISSQGITTASVSLSGEGAPDAMWAYRAGEGTKRELTVTTERGTAVLTWLGNTAPKLVMNCQPVDFTSAVESSAPVTPWSDAVRAFDLLDAARRSLTRRRTVELQFESTSERSQFKTQMTTVGCLLLLLTMFGLIGLLFAGRMFDPRDTQQKQSEVAGFVLESDQFDGVQLNSHGRETLREIVDNYQRRSATILIEGNPADAEPTQRREEVIEELRAAQLADAEVRTLVRPLQGRWFKRGMLLAWVVLFLPLGVLIAVQLLLGVTPLPDAAQPKAQQNTSQSGN